MKQNEYEEKIKRYEEIKFILKTYSPEKAIDYVKKFMEDYPEDYYIKFDYCRCLSYIDKIRYIEELEKIAFIPSKVQNISLYCLCKSYFFNKQYDEFLSLLQYIKTIENFPKDNYKYLLTLECKIMKDSEQKEKLLKNISMKNTILGYTCYLKYLTLKDNKYLKENYKEIKERLLLILDDQESLPIKYRILKFLKRLEKINNNEEETIKYSSLLYSIATNKDDENLLDFAVDNSQKRLTQIEKFNKKYNIK